MVTEEILDNSTETLTNILVELGSVGLWLQAIGAIILVWIIFQIVSWILNHKRLKRLDRLEKKIENVDKKLDKIFKNQTRQTVL
jgi:hypothetical protein